MTPPQLWIALATVYVVWGSTYLAIRVMVETIPPLLGTGARFTIAGTLMYAFLFARGRVRVERAELVGPAVIGLLVLVGGIGLLSIAEQVVPSGLAALLIASIPFCVVVIRMLIRERVPVATLVGVIVGFGGIALLVLPGTRPRGVELWGVGLILLCSVLSAIATVVSPRLRHPSDPLLSTAVQMLIGGVVMILAAVIGGELDGLRLDEITARSLVAFAYLVAIGSLVAYTAFVWLLANAPPSTTSTYAYVNPVVALVLGALVLSEPITPVIFAAAGVIVASVAFVLRAEMGQDATLRS
jgi:drug/metabolite transporter (DMT)-like permease